MGTIASVDLEEAVFLDCEIDTASIIRLQLQLFTQCDNLSLSFKRCIVDFPSLAHFSHFDLMNCRLSPFD